MLADLAHPLLGAAAGLRGGDDEQLVAAPQQRVWRAGTNPLSSRTTSVTFAPAGSRSSNSSTPCSWDARPDLHLQHVRAHLLQRGGLDVDVDGERGSASPSRRATQGRVGACTMVKITTSTKTRSKSQSTPGVPAVRGTVASTTGTAPRSPAQDRNACSRHGTRNGVIDTSTDSGPGQQQQDQPDAEGRQRRTRAGWPGWRAGRAGRTARSGPASPGPGRRTGRPGGAAAACCPARAPPGSVAMNPLVCSERRRRRTRGRSARRRRWRTGADEAEATSRSSRPPP